MWLCLTNKGCFVFICSIGNMGRHPLNYYAIIVPTTAYRNQKNSGCHKIQLAFKSSSKRLHCIKLNSKVLFRFNKPLLVCVLINAHIFETHKLTLGPKTSPTVTDVLS